MDVCVLRHARACARTLTHLIDGVGCQISRFNTVGSLGAQNSEANSVIFNILLVLF